jgi:hypothetical protein
MQQEREKQLQVTLRGAMGRCGGLHLSGTSGTEGRYVGAAIQRLGRRCFTQVTSSFELVTFSNLREASRSF